MTENITANIVQSHISLNVPAIQRRGFAKTRLELWTFNGAQ